jgi:hypothetical protein
MKYDYINIRKKENLHKIVWACAYEHTSSKNEKHFYCKPIKGMLTTTSYDIESERYNLTHYKLNYPTYFVPFRKNAKDLTLENLAWSKAVHLTARYYADTEAESIEQYNELVLTTIKEILPIIQKDTNELILDNLTPEQIANINAIKNLTI